nr:ubiquitin-like protein ATG12 [Ciona intestinalis]|eukprot:XP_004226941.1 ubiquitin-like protein ATG12 [Ciona intestinalis]
MDQEDAKTEDDRPTKVDVLLRPAGDAPILKKKKWQVDSAKTVEWVVGFLRKLLKCEDSDSLFLYVNQAFAPSPDRDIGSLYECFGSDEKLVLHYAKTQAWG